MKKLVSGILVTALALGIGTTAYVTYAHGGDSNVGLTPRINNEQSQNQSPNVNREQYQDFMEQQGVDVNEMEQYMEQQGIDVNEMYEWMNTNPDINEMHNYMQNQNINFGQAQKFMQEVNPNLSTEDIQDSYRSMHGTQGSSSSRNFGGMRN